ncbi:RHS repeat-associated core domain-containing protein [Chamaesiphon sp. VAR_48_metabat_403]|uniref:RHS repeat domain-containing protein n=1 Tax=Chamaesiphon sp. VAR_48_metabat_403 TaxID=2964700 RepID=UPI00286DAC4A|nr:RHS repeat-associated core domain-containing protein [Chamaesiphon sp. VAR_48_metabat_403]
MADNGNGQKFKTHVELDLEGNQRSVQDALGRIVMRYDYDMLGDRIHQASMEAGDRWMLNNVAGKPMRMLDSRNHVLRTVYDALQRSTQLFVKKGGEPEFLAEQTIYGEDRGVAMNHRGQIYQHFDGAGVATNVEFDFKGNLVSSSRQLVRDYKTVPNWLLSPLPGLEEEIFSSSTRYDALNRPVQLVAPHSSLPNAKLNVMRPGYNEANLLERMDVWLGEVTEPTTILDPQSANFQAVVNIDRDAKGQRTLIEYGNGAKTEYTYDPQTFRLVHLKTTRGAAVLQDLFYTYDPVGNITRIRDDAQQTIFFKNQVVLPHCDYSYDPIYRLVEAMGREHIGQAGQPQETKWDDEFRVNLSHPSDGQAMRNYTEQYVYDAVGNFERLIHQAATGTWTRGYVYNEGSLVEPGKLSNRLSSTTVGTKTEPYSYDAHGNMTSMSHLTLMQWNYKDELSVTSRQAVNATPPPMQVPEMTFYVYDAGGERVRKVTERQNGSRKDERIYLGGFEIYREFMGVGNEVKLERETLHVMDDKQRIALVETKTFSDPSDESPLQLIRFQFGNHLGSASLELDDQAKVISYEEYYPYGSSAYQAVDKSVKAAANRYRYTGKERDEETGLYYFGARYYASWICQWVSCDPKSLLNKKPKFNHSSLSPSNEEQKNEIFNLTDKIGSPNTTASRNNLLPVLYGFVDNNPICRIDPDGRDFFEWKTVKEVWAAAWNPRAAMKTKTLIFDDKVETEKPTFNTLAVRFSTKLGLVENKEREGSQVNAFRHTLWQALLTKQFDQSTAKEFADSHESNPDAISQEDATTKEFDTLNAADQSIDLRNNIIGREIGEKNRNVIGGPHQLAKVLLQEYHEKGLWVAEKRQDNGKYKAVLQKLSDIEFADASQKLSNLDNLGLNPSDAKKRQDVLDTRWSEQVKRKANEITGGIEWSIKRLYGVP